MERGIAPLGIEAGSSTAARNAARSPTRKAASMFFHRAANGPAREQYEIVYQPITSGDAGKL